MGRASLGAGPEDLQSPEAFDYAGKGCWTHSRRLHRGIAFCCGVLWFASFFVFIFPRRSTLPPMPQQLVARNGQIILHKAGVGSNQENLQETMI